MPLSIAHLLAHQNVTFLALVACPHSSFTFIYNPLLYSVPAVETNADFLSLSPKGAVNEDVKTRFQPHFSREVPGQPGGPAASIGATAAAESSFP